MAKLTYTFGESAGYSTVSVKYIGRDSFDWKAQYRWTVKTGRDGETVSGEDLRSPASDPLPQVLEALLGFLGAFAEARQRGNPDSDNWTLFPASLAEWATAMADELSAAQLDFRRL